MKAFRKKGSRAGSKKAVNPAVTVGSVRKNSRNTKLIAGVVLVVIVLIAGIYYLYDTQQSRKAAVNNVCESSAAGDVLEKSAALLAPAKQADLKPLVEKIQGLKNYDRDPNCLMVVTSYYANIGDPVKARLNLDKLKKVYPEDGKFSDKIGGNVRTSTELEAQTKFLEESAAQTIKNGKMLPIL